MDRDALEAERDNLLLQIMYTEMSASKHDKIAKRMKEIKILLTKT